jgi:hypothetical protein
MRNLFDVYRMNAEMDNDRMASTGPTKLTERQRAAIEAGRAGIREVSLGRSLGRKLLRVMSPKSDVDASCIGLWKFQKQRQKHAARRPIDNMNGEMKSYLKRLIAQLDLKEGEILPFGFGDGQIASQLFGPADAFEPRSGLAWYAIEIERKYENCRSQLRLGEGERAAYHAFHLGMLVHEFLHMEAAGDFVEQAISVKLAQRESGRRSMKVPLETRKNCYQKFRAAGDKKTIAAENAANELGISKGSISNAFGGRLPD